VPRHLRLDIIVFLSNRLQRQLLPEWLRLDLKISTIITLTLLPLIFLFIHHHLWDRDVPFGNLPRLLKLIRDLKSLYHWFFWVPHIIIRLVCFLDCKFADIKRGRLTIPSYDTGASVQAVAVAQLDLDFALSCYCGLLAGIEWICMLRLLFPSSFHF
jgi:hypothetical protein